MPEFTTAEINAELDALEHSDFRALPALGKAELKRRKASRFNAGRPVVNDTEKHKKWREAAARYRSKP